jgi:hypothetical protein
VRAQLRLAWVRWGLPGRFRVDNGWPWGSRNEFPTDLSLWLIGMGVGMHWNNPRRPQENGVVERSQGTSARWCEPWTCRTPAELQARLERMDRLHREFYPYQRRLSCRSRPAREPFSRATVSQLSGCRIRIDHWNADAGVLAKIQSGLVQGQAVQSCPEIELVSLGSAIEAAKEPPRQLN